MIRKADEVTVEYREHMRGGPGTAQVTKFIAGDEELQNKGRLFAKITLVPGAGVGHHEHEKDSELFYILSGTPDYEDNGKMVKLQPGDVTICPPGETHAITNNTDEPVEVIAVIVYA
jgi:mannose-6-phosphate isomerase-like protein (cupin superfamily)